MSLGAPEIILIIIAVLLLFGYKKLPDASRSIGRSLRIFKGEMKGLKDDDVRDQGAGHRRRRSAARSSHRAPARPVPATATPPGWPRRPAPPSCAPPSCAPAPSRPAPPSPRRRPPRVLADPPPR